MSKYYDIEWTQTASVDLDEIIDYISLDSISQAIKIKNRLISKVDSLAKLPQRGRIVPELRKFGIISYREILISPYRVFYKIEKYKSLVIILGVLDGRRDLVSLLIERVINC